MTAIAVLATIVVAMAGGWFVGEHGSLPKQAFSPVYRVSLPPVSAPGQTAAPERPQETGVKEVIRQVTDPQQAAALNALNQDLTREHQRSAQLETDLAQEKSALQDSEKKLLAATRPQPPSEDLQKQLAAVTSRTQELDRQVNTYRSLLEIQRKRLDQNLQLASMVSDPDLRVVKLRATEKQNTVEGHALIAGTSQMAFYASALPELAANRVYQVWLLRSNGRPIASAGIFTPDSAKRGFVQLKDPTLLSGVTAIAMTDEPMGGSTLPTGHKWLVGS